LRRTATNLFRFSVPVRHTGMNPLPATHHRAERKELKG